MSTSYQPLPRGRSLTLPNLTIIPEIEVSPAESFKYSTESRKFWEETTELLKNLTNLRHEVEGIPCPCRKSDCPFATKNLSKKKHPNVYSSAPHLHTGSTVRTTGFGSNIRGDELAEGCLTRSAHSHVATYLLDVHRYNSAIVTQDCEISEEPLGLGNPSRHFVRSSPSRRGKRKHMSLRVSTSYPTTMNQLMVPCWNTFELSQSLPSEFGSSLNGRSIDSLDSTRLQDIRRSHLKTYSSSSSESIHW